MTNVTNLELEQRAAHLARQMNLCEHVSSGGSHYCHLAPGHDGDHEAPSRRGTAHWTDADRRARYVPTPQLIAAQAAVAALELERQAAVTRLEARYAAAGKPLPLLAALMDQVRK